ncbi:MAG: DUF4438 domain-containing protein [Defluviitaleaceae bacterium]|nr:DUF4438 domain-containing protein [Defluviitaleaceae bacterium]
MKNSEIGHDEAGTFWHIHFYMFQLADKYMLKTNKEKLPIISVQGAVSPPTMRGPRIDVEGRVHYFPGTGGITYNAKIGDPCCGWAADHLEPGVSSKSSDDLINRAYNTYSCIGNEAKIISGDAKGALGIVVGKHGGIEHLMIHFDDKTLEKLSIEDKILVKSQGQGMELIDYPDIMLRSMSPALLEKMNITEENGALKIGVAAIAPASIMGSGIGMLPSASGDYDITLFDRKIAEANGLMDLRFGDIVALVDADTRYGRTFVTGAVTIGVIVHSDCVVSGHGPGVTTLMSACDNKIIPFIDRNANLKNFFL